MLACILIWALLRAKIRSPEVICSRITKTMIYTCVEQFGTNTTLTQSLISWGLISLISLPVVARLWFLRSALTIFYPRMYSSAEYAMPIAHVSVCPPVCPSQVDVLLKWLDGSSWLLAWKLPSTYPTLCYKEIQASAKLRILFSGNLP